MTSCKQFDLGNPEYAEKIHLVFVREWVRANVGNEAVQDVDEAIRSGEPLNIPDSVLEDIQNVMVAMIEGGDAVPGVWQQDDDTCYQDWTRTACFARWYVMQVPERKTEIRTMLSGQNTKPWLSYENGEASVAPCAPGKLGTVDCCPSTVWADPAYLNIDPPQDEGWPWWTLGLAAVGLGVTAAWVKAKW